MASTFQESSSFDDHFLTCPVCVLHYGTHNVNVPKALEGAGPSFRQYQASEAVRGQTFCPNHGNRETFYNQPRGDEQGPAEFASVAESQKQVLHELLGKLEPRAREVDFALNDVKMEMSQMPAFSNTAIEQAKAYFDHLIALLQKRKEETVKKIVSVHQEVGGSLQAQKEKMESESAGLASAAEFCKQVLEHGSEVEERDLERISERVEALFATPTDLTSKPSQVMLLKRKSVEDFGVDVSRAVSPQVQVREKVDASKCAVDIEIQPAVTEFSRASLLTTVDRYGRPCVVPVKNITAILMNPSGERVPTQVKEKGMGVWEISYTPEITGKHRLQVEVNGRPVAGSPFDVNVESSHTPVFTVGHYTEVKDLPHPTDVAMDMQGNIAVVEEGNKRADGSLVREIGKGYLRYPWFTAVDEPRGLVYVTDHHALDDNNNVLVFDLKGKFQFGFGKKGGKGGEFQNPSGIALDRAGNVLVVSRLDGRLQVFTPDGRYVKTAVKIRGGYPMGIALTPDGYVAVACCWGNQTEFYKYN
ncbi:tripartite motif-containing protein 3-like [Branchiostoma floridae]|uniref:Tripartite motif-containing protein 3-like n=1 Tax=Branchiostoma floridae TaxID=7739 RepID=A0A9J7MSH7_BRAFL|nr:tripartite motif-containing protein 3-like [Branchiostoma floridae]